MRICIVIGGDRTGKSVLTKHFTSKGWEYVHFNPPKGSPYAEYREFLDNALKDPANRKKNFIIDRYMYCEFPYSRHFGRATDMTLDRMNEIEDEILALDPKARIVYCENDIDINWELLAAEGRNDFKNKDEVRELRKEYRRVLKWAHIPAIEYDYTLGDEPEQIYDEVMNAK